MATAGSFPPTCVNLAAAIFCACSRRKGSKAITLPIEATRFGAIESLSDAQKCADLFKAHREEISGVLVTLPNFGDERAVANALRWAGLKVPVLVHAFNDDGKKMTIRATVPPTTGCVLFDAFLAGASSSSSSLSPGPPLEQVIIGSCYNRTDDVEQRRHRSPRRH